MILGVDVGGTFTDAVLIDDGAVAGTGKAPTTPDDQSAGVLAAVEAALAGRPAAEVERFVHGMTVGTNALLEGSTARTACVATEGFTDIEELGRQARPDLYRLCVAGPDPIVPPELRVAAPERCGPGGVIDAARPGPPARAPRGARPGRRIRRRLPAVGLPPPRARARCRGDRPRRAPGRPRVALARDSGGVPRVRAHGHHGRRRRRLSPPARATSRRLTDRTRAAGLPGAEIMLSSGGVVDAAAAAEHGSWTVLSGPAGGAVAAARAAAAAGAENAVGLDMGGTSCDVSLVLDGDVAVTGGREVGGPRAGAADGRHPHGRRGRRLDRVGRRRRRAPRRPARRRAPGPGPPVTATAAPSRR